MNAPKYPRLIPVIKWNDYYEWPSIRAIRNLIFWNKNNFDTEVIRRMGRRVFIDEEAFFNWSRENKGI